MLANSRLQFLLDRFGRCLKLFVSTKSISCHELSRVRVSVWPINFFKCKKYPKLSRIPSRPCQCLFEWSSDRSLFAGQDRSPATTYNFISGNNSDHIGPSGIRLSQNGEMQQVKTATRDYTFTASKMWFRNYYVAYAFQKTIMKNCFLRLSRLKIHIILFLDIMLRYGA